MANRYWVGGSGTWNTTSTTNWSASSGGASGASVPTAADSVFFDQAGTYTVTCTGALACLDITVSAGTVTFAQGTSPTLDVRGSMTLLAGTVWGLLGTALQFSATTTGKTITTNGVSFGSCAVRFTGAGGGWTLGSALLTTNLISLDAGTFDTANYSVTCSLIRADITITTRQLNLGSSTITTTGFSSGFSATIITGFTFNAGTSQINIGANDGRITTAGLVFYNVAFTSTTAGTKIITGANTFNNLAITGPSTAGVTTITFDSQQTINGTLSTTGTAGNRRVFFASATYGISVDLVVNSAPSLTDADFRGLYVRGTAAPISGTRIGNRGECRNITFSTPKTVYWNLAGAQNWSANGWAATSTGTPSTDYFPLPQDTATFTNAGSVTGTISLDSAIPYIGSIDMSARTSAMTISFISQYTVYGNWTNGSGTTLSTVNTTTFSGGGTQTITSAGKTFPGGIAIDTYGGTVQLADALNIGTNTLTITNGTFNTQGYAVTAGTLSSSNSNVRTINLGASVITLSNTVTLATTYLTFNAGTSQINIASTGTTLTGGVTFYNVSYTGIGSPIFAINGASIFNNLTVDVPASTGIINVVCNANQTINGTLTCAGASAVRRIFLRSNTIGTTRTLTVGTLSAQDCDFRDITIAGTASGSSPTRAGDCGNNAGITFPSPKTVYWNLAGVQSWSATGWATSSGGSPAVNNFPLAQDTAVFDNTGSVGTVYMDAAWNIGTFDASGRTSAMAISAMTISSIVYGDWKFGTGVTSSSTTGTITFSKNGTQTITSNGVQFGCNVTVNNPLGTVQLADALSLEATRTLTLTTGTFDAVTYNVTTGLFSSAAATTTKMGSGTWTLSGTGTVWSYSTASTLIAGTSTIVLSDTSTTARTFAGGNLYYNKLTIGGTTGTSTLTITGGNRFGEIASTKTVAHTITLPSGVNTTVGKWSVTGTVGNVVTLTPSTAASVYTLIIAGPANTGIDYLSVSYCVVSTTSPGEFYVGANSTNTAGNTGAIIFTATPSPRTLYWVGGTGNWSSTTKWSTSSGGASGAAIPTSLDAVVFNSASNATAYTATIDAGVTIARCASFTMAGPLAGNVTFAGTVPIAFHGNVSFAATGITRTYTGAMNWAGNSSYTFDANGVAFSSSCTVIGIKSIWTLARNIVFGGATIDLTVTYGTFDTSASNYSVQVGTIISNNSNIRTISLNGSSVILAVTGTAAVINFAPISNLTFNAGTSTISSAATAPIFAGGGLTFNNVSFTNAAATSITITGANTFNTLSFAGQTTVGINAVTFSANQTISTLTLNAGTAAAYRTFLASDTIGTQRTLSVGTLTAGAADYDFRDIAITGAAAPLTGTRFGDAKGNSGITFPAAKTVYWQNTPTGGNWSASAWAPSIGGISAAANFPLAQDTAVIPSGSPNTATTITINANYNIGTIDMSARTANTMTLAMGATTPAIYGNWVNGTGITQTSTGTITFAGRGSQTITSAGRTFAPRVAIDTLSGSVTLQDALTINYGASNALNHISGTFNAVSYNVTLANASDGVTSSSSSIRTLALGSGTWTIAGTSVWSAATATNLTVTGTGTISLTSASAKQFTGGGVSYSGITLNNAGAGALTITGNNTFKDITNTYSATGAATISFGATITTLTQFTGTGAAAKLLTLSGTSAASPATLILTSGTVTTPDYLSISNVRAYSLSSTWYAGANSTNLGSLGWIFAAGGGVIYNVTITETGTGTDAVSTRVVFNSATAETATGSDTFQAGLLYLSTLSETATGTDSVAASFVFSGAILESASATETVLARATFRSTIADTATGTDSVNAPGSTYNPRIAETGTASDLFTAINGFFVYIAETATGSDITQGNVVFLSSTSDTATGTDSITARATLKGQISESASGADLVFGRLGAVGNISESATGTDVFVTSTAFGAIVLNLASVTDAASARAVFVPLVIETATGTDVVTAPGSTYNPSIVETSSASQINSAAAVFPVSFVDSATGTQTNSAAFLPLSRIVEIATGTDTDSANVGFGTSVAESATIFDLALVAPSTFNAPVVELATITDALTAPGSIYNPSLVETINISDFVIGGYLWNPIDDTQIANWGDIDDVQLAGWVQLDDTQAPNWQNVNNTQASGWNEIDDSQDPNWVSIQQNP